MATLVLGTIGRAVGGRVGGLIGTVVGSALDRSLLGGGRSREGARLGTLAVQSSAYGEPIPRCYGRMRVAGNLVWSAGIREARARTGSSKRGAATTSYSYSASFAVIVSGRPIVEIGRIWADGKLLRGADGAFIYPATIRCHLGSEDQPVDPLIAAVEGIGSAPAYRGRAYVVFEDLPLADYGNRIPNLTFEVIADRGEGVVIDRIANDLAAATRVPIATSGDWPILHGFVALRDTLRETLAQLDEVTDFSVIAAAAGLHLRASGALVPTPIGESDLGATNGDRVAARLATRAPSTTVPDAVSVAFSDPSRDYQSGQQRVVRRTPAPRVEQRSFDVALDASAAKSLAGKILRRAAAARTTASLTVPWRHAGIMPGDVVLAGDDPQPWRVRTTALVGPVVELGVERIANEHAAAREADAGRSIDPGDRPPGTTVLHVLDLPPLPGSTPSSPRLLLAAGSSGRWPRPTVIVSSDGGASYTPAVALDVAAAVGVMTSVLPAGAADRWDRLSTIDVTLLDPDIWLESRSEAAVLGGANLALVGDEIIQFADVLPLAPNQFRLSTLLRGRRGTEHAVAGHAPNERFIVLDDAIGTFDVSTEAIGSTLIFKAVGPGEDSAAIDPVSVTVIGNAVRPLAPVFVTSAVADGGVDLRWVRRSRAGFGWADGIDAPLAEDGESYRLTVASGGRVLRTATTGSPSWRYDPALIATDGIVPGTDLLFSIAQLSATAGLGHVATHVRTL